MTHTQPPSCAEPTRRRLSAFEADALAAAIEKRGWIPGGAGLLVLLDRALGELRRCASRTS